MFPSLTPRPTDPLWFAVDKPVDEMTELARQEAEHSQVRHSWNQGLGHANNFPVKALEKISKQGSDLTPIGKNGNDQIEDTEEEEDEDEGKSLSIVQTVLIFEHLDSESDHEDEDEEDVDAGNNFNQEDHINQN